MTEIPLRGISDQTGKNRLTWPFISQTLTLLEKLNELDADERADICESLHDHADSFTAAALARFGDDGENL
jgi:hypothetical protein